MSISAKAQALILHENDIASRPSDIFPDAAIGGTVSWKTLISRPATATDALTVGIATCAPGREEKCPAGHLKLHRHSHAELYHVVGGRGVVTIDGEEYVVEKGSVVFIPGNAEHGIRCVGEEEVRWLYVFAADGFGEIVYRFDEDGKGKEAERVRLNAKL